MTRERTVHRVSRLWHRPLALGIALLVVQAGAPAAAQEASPAAAQEASPAAATIELAPCDLIASEGRQEVNARCGTLAVPLDFDNPEGEQIQLFVAVVDALAEEAEPDPLVVIAGGPGDASTRFFAMSEAAFSRILRRRDVVLVDQRGTGQSAALACEALQDDQMLDGADLDAVVRTTLDCLGELEHDPRFFTTSVAVKDLDAVRAALGYERMNVYGISYGTRVAQHYLRRFPARTRSVILDGVLPPDVALGPEVAIASQAALDALFQRCATDDPCHAAFPELRERFYALLDRLDQAPVAVTIDHPRTGEATEVTLDRLAMVAVVRLLVYSPQTASVLPVLVESAYAGDYRALASQALFLEAGVKDIAIGLNYAVVCTEDAPYVGDLDMAAQADTYMGTAFVEVLDRICDKWPRGTMDSDLREPLATDLPVLLLSGELDPITPPEYARRSAARMTNSVHVVGPGQGHGMLMVRCAQRLMADFVDAADPGALDLACVERVGPFPLFTSPLGPSP